MNEISSGLAFRWKDMSAERGMVGSVAAAMAKGTTCQCAPYSSTSDGTIPQMIANDDGVTNRVVLDLGPSGIPPPTHSVQAWNGSNSTNMMASADRAPAAANEAAATRVPSDGDDAVKAADDLNGPALVPVPVASDGHRPLQSAGAAPIPGSQAAPLSIGDKIEDDGGTYEAVASIRANVGSSGALGMAGAAALPLGRPPPSQPQPPRERMIVVNNETRLSEVPWVRAHEAIRELQLPRDLLKSLLANQDLHSFAPKHFFVRLNMSSAQPRTSQYVGGQIVSISGDVLEVVGIDSPTLRNGVQRTHLQHASNTIFSHEETAEVLRKVRDGSVPDMEIGTIRRLVESKVQGQRALSPSGWKGSQALPPQALPPQALPPPCAPSRALPRAAAHEAAPSSSAVELAAAPSCLSPPHAWADGVDPPAASPSVAAADSASALPPCAGLGLGSFGFLGFGFSFAFGLSACAASR